MTEKCIPVTGMDDPDLASQPTVLRDDLFRGNVVLVSGGGTGIGRATAALFARLGADVVICGRNGEKLDSARELISRFGTKITTQIMTVRNPDQVEALMKRVWDIHGQLDILVNNAGGQFAQATMDISPKGWNAVIDTNLNGTFYMMQAAARRWRDTGKPGAIINVIAAIWRGMPQVSHSCAARAGVAFLTKSVATEWAPHNIRVNCVAPGTIRSEGFGNYPAPARASFEQANPMLRSGKPWDIAEAIAYLGSNAGNFVTGETLNVDGGSQNWGDPWFLGRPRYFEFDYEISRLSGEVR